MQHNKKRHLSTPGYDRLKHVKLEKPENAFTIREYKPEDRAKVVEMVTGGLLEFAQTEAQKKSTKEFTDQTINRDLNTLEKQTREKNLPFNRRFWVAVQGDKIIGCISLQPTMMAPRDSTKSANIHSLSVLPDHRKKGVATKLLETLEKHCAECKIETIKLTTQTNLTGAIKLYEKHGYTLKTRETWNGLELLKYTKPTPKPEVVDEPAVTSRKREFSAV